MSAWVWLVFGVPSLLSSILVIDYERTGAWMSWVIFTCVSWATPVVSLWVLRIALLPLKPGSKRSLATLAAFFLASVARGVALAATESALNLVLSSDAVGRFISEAIVMTIGLSIIAVVVSARITYRDALLELAQDRQELLQLQMAAAEQSHTQRDALVSEAQAVLGPLLNSLNESLQGARDADALASISLRMREIVDNTIRPLSASLAARSPVIQRSEVFVPSMRVSPLRESNRYTLGSFFLPLTTTVFMILMTTPAFIVVVGLPEAVKALELMVLGVYVLGWMAKLACARWRLGPAMASAFFAGIYALIGFFTIGLFSLAGLDVTLLLLLGWVFLLVAAAYLLFRYQLVEWARADGLNHQTEVNEQLDLVLSGVRQQARIDAKRVATVIHGPVQTALYAAAIRVSNAGRVDGPDVRTALRDLESAMAKLNADFSESLKLDQFVAEMSSVWGPSVTLDFDQTAVVARTLDANPTARACVTEVIREGVNNAIKHGAATSITIRVTNAGQNLVEVVVQNTGVVAEPRADSGFGAHILDDLTHVWSLSDDGLVTTLWAIVVLDKIDETYLGDVTPVSSNQVQER